VWYHCLFLQFNKPQFDSSLIHSFIPFARAEFDDSLPFSGASSIPLCYILFPATLPHHLFFHPLSPHLAIYFLLYLILRQFNSVTALTQPQPEEINCPQVYASSIRKQWVTASQCSVLWLLLYQKYGHTYK
jgi:hypothetical protein